MLFILFTFIIIIFIILLLHTRRYPQESDVAFTLLSLIVFNVGKMSCRLNNCEFFIELSNNLLKNNRVSTF